MDSLRDHAVRCDMVVEGLTGVRRELDRAVLPATLFGGDHPGLPGEVGRMLSDTWADAVADRSREAVELAGLVADLADGLRVAAEGYADSDAAAVQRYRRLP